MKVKIIGAGSIGNHLAQASRRMGWDVAVVDADKKALERMKNEIYPARYGAWDDNIKQYVSGSEPHGGFDVIMIGTPPDSHLPLATQILREEAPRVLQIEKPLCGPELNGLPEFFKEHEQNPQTKIVVGYDHVLGRNTLEAEALFKTAQLGSVMTIDSETRSEWSGILRAHPWLKGPEDTYLGYWQRGGGASGEHSHALNLWQHFAHVVGAGRVERVTGIFDFMCKNNTWYDRLCFLNLVTENGIRGRVVQDVVTVPKKKYASVQFQHGRVEWYCDVTKTLDRIVLMTSKEEAPLDIPKTRPDEFFQEIKHIQDILDGNVRYEDSPIRLERGLHTMFVLNAAHRSFAEKKEAKVIYDPYYPSKICY